MILASPVIGSVDPVKVQSYGANKYASNCGYYSSTTVDTPLCSTEQVSTSSNKWRYPTDYDLAWLMENNDARVVSIP